MNYEWLTQTPIAHRGLHSEGVSENSMAAFAAAEMAGYAIELDVQQIRDGAIAVFHDVTLDRMTDRGGFLADLSAFDLKETRLVGNGEPIPTIDAVLENIRAPLYIEIKSYGEAGMLEKRLLSLLRHFKSNAVIASMNPKSLIWFRQNAPDIPRGVISCRFDAPEDARPFLERRRLRALKYNNAIKPAFISYALDALPYWRVSWRRKLLKTPVLAWTVRNAADLEKAKKVADNIVFEGFDPRAKPAEPAVQPAEQPAVQEAVISEIDRTAI